MQRSIRLTVLVLFAITSTAAMALPQKGDPVPRGQSEDPTYGYREENPIKVGGGPVNERRYMDSLQGPDGQEIRYKRLGSCCQFKTPNALANDLGLLDRYEVTYDGLEEPIVLYLNGYDHEKPLVPVGFTKEGVIVDTPGYRAKNQIGLADDEEKASVNTSRFDLLRIKRINSKGRVQDRNYNRDPVIDSIVQSGKEAVPVLIERLESDSRFEHRPLEPGRSLAGGLDNSPE